MLKCKHNFEFRLCPMCADNPEAFSSKVHALVGPEFHPPLGIMGGTVHGYRRTTSPWHRDAFPDEHKNAAPEQGGAPADGWMAEDWCGNPIAFFQDGMPWPNVTCDLRLRGKENDEN